MIKDEDRKYLNDPDYDMALEKFYSNDIYFRNDINNGTIKFAYPFSNEDLVTLFSFLKVKDKRVLTVGSSGDQLLNALYYGSKDVTVIDANLYAKPFIEYKIAAIKNLDLKNFKKYMMHERHAFMYEVYQKISHDLSGTIRTFWDTIILNQDYPSVTDVTLLFRSDVNNCQIRSEFYASEEAYKKLQNILRQGDFKITHVVAGIDEFVTETNGMYDVIILSNIARYVLNNHYFRELLDLYHTRLTPGGIMEAHYLFGDMEDVLKDEIKVFNKKYQKSKIAQFGVKPIEVCAGKDKIILVSKGSQTFMEEDEME